MIILHLNKIAKLLLWAVLPAILFTACNQDDDPNPTDPNALTNISEIVANGSDFTLLKAAIETAGGDLGTTLSSEGTLTVFAPTNAAFVAAGFADEAAVRAADPAFLTSVLTYHVIGSVAKSASLTSGAVATQNGQNVYLSVNGANIAINGKVKVTTADVDATNGVVHVIDNVLIPPTQNVAQIAVASSNASSPQFTALVAALTKAGLAGTLADGTKNFTVFAPTDAAFNEFLSQLGLTLDNVPTDLLSKILTYHVVSGNVFSTDLINGATPTTLNGANLTVNIANSEVTVSSLNTSKVTATNALGTNGVIHTIDKVLVPVADFTITQVAQVGDNFGLLKAAVVKAGLATTLSGGEFTVFAPVDQAFKDAGFADAAAINAANQTDISDIVTYHAIAAKALSTDLTSQAYTTVSQQDLYISTQGGVFINPSNPNQNIQVTTADVVTKNGVIHVIEKVILPAKSQFGEMGTIEDLVVKLAGANDDGEFSELKKAIIRANLLGVLDNSSTNFTVFAPTNAAFQALYQNLGVTGVDQIEVSTLEAVLKYHIVKQNTKVYSNNLSNGPVTMLTDGQITVNLDNGVELNATDGVLNRSLPNAKVTGANVVAANGVVHIIDQVLLP
ncbi:MAG TPA: hypothetical protein DCS93_41335 [Microscillaceae bacterium]|nr:hypothetical protein [Microscillaceae bacterium]